MWETQSRSLDQEDLLEKGMATHVCILTWRMPWTKEPGRLQPMGSGRVRQDWVTNTFTFTCWWNLYSISGSHPLSAFLNLSHFILKQIFLIDYLYSYSCFHHCCYNSSEKFLKKKERKYGSKYNILLMCRLLVSLFWAKSIEYFWFICVYIVEQYVYVYINGRIYT